MTKRKGQDGAVPASQGPHVYVTKVVAVPDVKLKRDVRDTAGTRLRDLFADIHGGVTEFHAAAEAIVTEVTGAEPDDKMGLELFKTFVDLSKLLFTEEEAAVEIIAACINTYATYVGEQSTIRQETATKDAAQELTRAISNLVTASIDGAKQARDRGMLFLAVDDPEGPLEKLVAANPEVAQMDADAVCDLLGIRAVWQHDMTKETKVGLLLRFNEIVDEVKDEMLVAAGGPGVFDSLDDALKRAKDLEAAKQRVEARKNQLRWRPEPQIDTSRPDNDPIFRE